MVTSARHHPPHRPQGSRVLATAGPPPLDRGTHHGLARRLPPPAPTLRTQGRPLPRLHQHRLHPHLLPQTRQMRWLLISPPTKSGTPRRLNGADRHIRLSLPSQQSLNQARANRRSLFSSSSSADRCELGLPPQHAFRIFVWRSSANMGALTCDAACASGASERCCTAVNAIRTATTQARLIGTSKLRAETVAGESAPDLATRPRYPGRVPPPRPRGKCPRSLPPGSPLRWGARNAESDR